ncbi:MAG: ABC-2 transporter permease [Phycisphaerales bacterium]|nr:ABC-2 transporter permease [Phycisphaerales bacterium]
MTVLHDIGLWLWHLLPGNPILTRVVATGGKRTRHLWARVAYLIVLVLVFVLGGGLLIGVGGQSLAELAKQSTRTFMAVSVVQLVLMSFIAPIFCAGAITQEKDSNTFHILLTTPLSNAQIVLGSLFSRLFFVWALLLAGLPIFCITMIYGGVTTKEIFESFGLAACTGLVAGSIAIMISFLKIGTRRTIFAFFAGVALYLLAVAAVGLSPWGQLPEARPAKVFFDGFNQYRMSVLAPVHPLLALLVVTGQTPAPTLGELARFARPIAWLLAYPQYGYMLLTTGASAAMILLSLIWVRRGALEGENSFWTAWRERFRPRGDGERRRRPRRVWNNPIAWREAATRASAGGRSLLRQLFIVIGLLLGVGLAVSYAAGQFGPAAQAAASARAFLIPLVWIELAVILLVVTTTAATTLTREKETLTMELLLCTPLTSKYIIAGMLQGLVRLVIPLIAVPAVTLAAFAVVDLLQRPAQPVAAIESVFLIPLQMVAFAAVAAMVGLHFSLLSKKTVQAVMLSAAIVLTSAGLLSACGLAVRASNEVVAGVFLPFTPLWGVEALIDPWTATERVARSSGGWGAVATGPTPSQYAAFRLTRLIFTLVAVGMYLGVTMALYSNMVRNFDMTVRRQSS